MARKRKSSRSSRSSNTPSSAKRANPGVTVVDSNKPVFDQAKADAYWKRNLNLIGILMSIWALVSLVAAIILPWAIPAYNNIMVGNLPLGFWFAQQGSIIVFVVLIFVYCWLMDRLDREFDVNE